MQKILRNPPGGFLKLSGMIPNKKGLLGGFIDQ